MFNKKIILILTIILVSLFAISAVSAADNATSDVVSVEKTTTNAIRVEQIHEVINTEDNQAIIGNDESQYNMSSHNDKLDAELLTATFPSYSDYSASVSDTIIGDNGGQIHVSISPAKGFTYYSCYYLKIYDSHNQVKFSQLEGASYYHIGKYFSINSNQLSVGTYTIKLINYVDGKVMDTAKLTVKPTYPPSSDYSVSVSDTSMDYGVKGYISMSINPASTYLYSYYYYLKVYDLKNDEKISHLVWGKNPYKSETYKVNPSQLSAGTYIIKLINYVDGNVMDTAKLTVKPTYPSSSDYSVSVSDTNIDYKVGGSISMSISPASGSTYYYCYYLKVYDSNNNEMISQLYNGTRNDDSKSYNIEPNQLRSGNYTIKLVNYADGEVMDVAKLTAIFPSSTDYSVSVSDIDIEYGLRESIFMRITPSYNSIYKYYYYLKVYDLNNNEKISQLYYSISSSYSETYSIDPYQLSPGTYAIKIINYNDNYLIDTAKLNVKKIKTFVSSNDILTIYGKTKNLIVTLKDDQNHLLSGKTVYVKLNGKTYSDKTNYNGQISINVPTNIAPKTYTASVTFSGDERYSDSSCDVNIAVAKITPKITVKSISGNPGKKVKITAKVKDDFGNAINKCTVTFKVNGKTYTAKTNSKGIATLKIKIPKSKAVKVSAKTKNKIVTKTTNYKKTYNCVARVSEDGIYNVGSTKFKVTSKNKKIQKYKIVKRQTKTITIPYKKWGLKKKTSGHYVFGIFHEQREGNKISVMAGDKILQQFIKFSSNAYYIKNGEKVYPWKWLTSKRNDDIHEYYYTGDAKIYVIIKYDEYTYKKI